MMVGKTTLIVVTISALIGGAVTHLYYQGEIADYKLQKEREYSQALEEKIEENRKLQVTISKIESDLLTQKEEYEKAIGDLWAKYTFNGVLDCTRDGECMPRADGDTANIVCYRTRDLSERISRSLVIGEKADNLAMRYNALLKICKKDSL